MGFQFTLEAVLHYRTALEDNERLKLEALLARQHGMERQQQELQTAVITLQKSLREAMAHAAVRAVELHLAITQVQGLQQRQQTLAGELCRVRSEAAQQSQRYRKARQEREVLEALRESQRRLYLVEQRRREQRQLDELHLLRRRFRNGFA